AAAEEIPLPTAAAAKAARASAISKAAAAFKVLRARALREKANAGSPSTAEQRYRQAIFVLSILLVIMTTAVVILMLRRIPSHPRVEDAAVRPASPSAAESVAAPPPAKAAPTPVPAPAPVAPPPDRFALDLGTFPSREQAEAERDRVVASTNLRGWIVTGSGDEAGTYRLLVGVYSSRARAANSAGRLIQDGLATEANVITLPLRRKRQ